MFCCVQQPESTDIVPEKQQSDVLPQGIVEMLNSTVFATYWQLVVSFFIYCIVLIHCVLVKLYFILHLHV